MRRQRIKYQIILTIILVLSVFLSAGLSSAGTSDPPPPVNALVGDTLNTNRIHRPHGQTCPVSGWIG